MKIAYFSPLNPQPSGISDYSEELLPHLAEAFDITLFADGFRPTNEALLSRFRCLDYRGDRSLLRTLGGFDAIVYQMGNDHRYHAGMLEAARQVPGIVVFHDFALQDFFLGLARERGDLNIYLEEAEFCHGPEARLEAERALERGGAPPAVARPLDFPFNCRLARSSEAIIVHSEWSRERFREVAPGVPVARISLPVKPQTAAHRHTAADGRRGVVRIANFGLITPGKGIERARVSLAEFEQHIAATDIALNMRERTVGETSASLCRIMAAGVAAIVSDVGWFAELPADVVVKIPQSGYADALLEAYLRRLIEDPQLRARIGANARRYALDRHSIERSAADYISFIREVVAQRARRHFVGGVAKELAALGVRASDDGLLRRVASEVAALAPARATEDEGSK
jgi:glycosyltransferase involved in cell wall biosynthesis